MQEISAGVLRRRPAWQQHTRYGTLIFLVLEIVLFSILASKSFPSVTNMVNVASQISLLAIVAAGLTFPLVMNDFDLSIGYMASFTSMVVAGQMKHWGVLPTIGLGLAMGLAIGYINGFIVTRFNMNSIISSLGVGTILTGLNYVYGKGANLFGGIPKTFLFLGRGKILGIPALVLVMAAVVAVCYVILSRTYLGRQLYAIGGNREAARLSGINITSNRMIGFIMCGLLSGITGILLVARVGGGNPQGGDGFLLDALTACFLGAASLRIGQFHITGTLIGVLIMGVAANGLTLLNVPFFWQTILRGAILLISVALSGLARNLRA